MTPPPAAVAARTAPAVHPRRAPLVPVRRPRRVSGPAARPARPALKARRATSTASAVATHPLLDRLIHGRAWIGIVAFALIGIVTMQLGLLKLNAGIGRALEHEAALQRENSALSVENSEVAAGDTVELQAAHMGMQLIPGGALRFLSARGAGDLARAVSAARTPASAVSSTASPASTGTPESTATASGTESGTETTPSSTSTASGEGSIQSTSAATPASESTSSTESRTPAATSTVPAKTAEGASTPSPTPVSTGESGGASASPQG